MKTKKIFNKGKIIFIFSCIVIFLLKCSNNEISNPSSSEGSFSPEYPALNDTIPYDLLGSGKIVFERVGPYPDGYSAVYVLDIDHHKAWIDSNAGSQSTVCSSGTVIAFSEFTNIETEWNIYTVGLHNENRTQLTSLKMFEKFPSWSPDGSKIYFWTDGNETNPGTSLYVISAPPAVSNPKLLINFKDHEPSGRLAVSVTGKIAYVTNNCRDLTDNGLYILNEDGSDHHLIIHATDSLYFESPLFSQDGQYIYYLSVLRSSLPNGQYGDYQQVDLMRVNVDGSNPLLISTFPANGRLEWRDGQYLFKNNGVYLAQSPDGNKFLLNLPSGDYVSHLYVINADGSGLVQVTSADAVTDRCVSWGR